MSEYDGETRSAGGAGETIGAVAALVRLPNLFTAPPDVILGAAIVASLGYAVSVPAVALLAVASMLLYAAGTTLNDYFDAEEDTRERPERPIPSGAISRRGALAFGLSLLFAGVLVALATAGAVAGAAAATIALLVVLYDGVFKGTALGFLFMGASRGANVLLGTTVIVTVPDLPVWALSIPAVVTLYIAAVTYMAESETGESDPRSVSVAIVGAAVAVAGAAAVLVVQSPPLIDAATGALFLLAFVAWVGRALWGAYADPVPETIGPTIGVCILGLTLLNAAFAATAGVGWALATAAFLLPAMALSTLFDVS
ncbi:UbiA family prenyltransferase [Halobacteria archaeon AArc-dxtr1]|nr:UbiA family prenyltransferase [Halobacteria archaeon AArc-dxtr1]